MDEWLWWQRGIIYQIYPRSFQDSNGDGIGDLMGIRRRLPYLQALGVDALWLSPIFPSPMADCGYDVSDYCDIDPCFGTLADFDALLADAHARGLKLILDFVPNHTSDRHPWFVESRATRTNPKRDWYLWRDPAPGGGPPTNWQSEFGGSAWQLDPATGQYYYHAFLKEQPDLDWRNPAVRAAMHDVLRFWLDRGVDGFRVDVLWHLIKDDRFRDNPTNPAWRLGDPPRERLLTVYTTDRPELPPIVAALRRVIDGYAARVLIGEIYLPIERLVTYYGADRDGAHLPFNFHLILTAWNARAIAALIDRYEAALPPGGWPNWVLGNHDQRRVASRIGPAQARIAAMLLLTLRGTPTLYYGDELGMTDVAIPPDRVQDRYEINVPGIGVGRDPARTPMPWDDSIGAGFTSVTPWLPISDDAGARNVTHLDRDPDSILALYRALIALRRSHPALSVGDYRAVAAQGDLLAYRRERGADRLLVVLNLGAQPTAQSLPEDAVGARVVLSTHRRRAAGAVGSVLALDADEGVILATP